MKCEVKDCATPKARVRRCGGRRSKVKVYVCVECLKRLEKLLAQMTAERN